MESYGDVVLPGGNLTVASNFVRAAIVEFLVLGPKCPVGEAKPRQNTRNPQLAVQGPFGTAEGRETMTATTETSLEVNTGP